MNSENNENPVKKLFDSFNNNEGNTNNEANLIDGQITNSISPKSNNEIIPTIESNNLSNELVQGIETNDLPNELPQQIDNGKIYSEQSQPLNENNGKKNNRKIIIIISILLIIIVIILALLLSNKKTKIINTESEKYLQSLDVIGFDLDSKFDKNKFEYNIEVDMDQIQITCTGPEGTTGCNVVIDLTDKDKYDHIIEVVNKSGKKTKYILHIKKDVSNINDPIRIKSITGVPLQWTNKNVQILVNAIFKNGDNGATYSFDNGTTWQDSNIKEVDSNQVLTILVKDSQGNISELKEISIDKIDKIKPTMQLIIYEKGRKKIILKSVASDSISGIEGISYNSSKYTTNKTYEVTKPGKYTAVTIDKAGNKSDEVGITIKDSDFVKENVVKEKTYTLNFDSNGAAISKSKIICTTKTDTCKIALPTITRTGAVIVGWGTTSNATAAKYKSGEIIDVSSDITLYAITYKLYNASFDKNGPETVIVSNPTKSCKAYNKNTTCIITASNLSRTGGSVLGWATINTAKESSLRPSENITLTGNAKFYAITYVTVTATFNKNKASSISYQEKKCKIFNENKSCGVTTPTISVPSGTSIIGWNTSSRSTTSLVNQNSVTSLLNDTTYYAIISKPITITLVQDSSYTMSSYTFSCTKYNDVCCNVKIPGFGSITTGYQIKGLSLTRDGAIKYDYLPITNECWDNDTKLYVNYTKEFDIAEVFTVGRKTIVVENGIMGGSVKVKTQLLKIYNKFPFIFNIEGRVNFLTATTFDKKWYEGALGMATGTTLADIRVNPIDGLQGHTSAIIHEMSHNWDNLYSSNTRTKKAKIGDIEEFSQLYNEYSKCGGKESTTEFFAAIVPAYYYKYIAPDQVEYANFQFEIFKVFANNCPTYDAFGKLKVLMENLIKDSQDAGIGI